MFLPLLLPMCVVSGEIVSERFKRVSGLSAASDAKRLIVSCAVSCISKERCLSYSIQTTDSVCKTLSFRCGQLKEMTCYSRKRVVENENARRSGNKRTYQKHITETIKNRTVKDAKGPTNRSDYLLVFPDYLPKHSVRKKNLETGLVTTYHGLTYVNLTAVAYMPKSRKLLLCIGKPYKITTYSLENKRKTPLRKAKAIAVAADEENGLIFYSLDMDSEDKGLVLSMTVKGRDYKPVKRTGKKAFNLVTDVKNHKLYIAYVDVIVAVNYKTSAEHTVLTGVKLKAITMDFKRGILYYSQKWNLCKKDLSRNTTKGVMNMWNEVEVMVFYHDKVFASSTGAVNVQVVKKLNSRRGSMKFLKFHEIGFHPYLCLADL